MKTTTIITIASAKLRLLIENYVLRIENFLYINTFLTYIKNGRTFRRSHLVMYNLSKLWGSLHFCPFDCLFYIVVSLLPLPTCFRGIKNLSP